MLNEHIIIIIISITNLFYDSVAIIECSRYQSVGQVHSLVGLEGLQHWHALDQGFVHLPLLEGGF